MKCIRCGKIFFNGRNQICDVCRTHKCEYCGEYFKTFESLNVIKKRRFCSNECVVKGRNKRKDAQTVNKYKCLYCGTKFESKRKNMKFCSRECGFKGRAPRKDARKSVVLICGTCKKEFGSKVHGAKFCSKECVYKNQEMRTAASKRLRNWNIKNRKLISDRMSGENNPTKNPKVLAKIKATQIMNGSFYEWKGERGGNGKLTKPQLMVCAMTGWEPELVIKTASHLKIGERKKWCEKQKIPHAYKVDVGNKDLKIAIEVDGKGHTNPKKIKIDQKKEKHLKRLGWRVLRFTNEEILKTPSKVLSQIKKEIKAS